MLLPVQIRRPVHTNRGLSGHCSQVSTYPVENRQQCAMVGATLMEFRIGWMCWMALKVSLKPTESRFVVDVSSLCISIRHKKRAGIARFDVPFCLFLSV